IALGDRLDFRADRRAARHALCDHHRQPAVADCLGDPHGIRTRPLCRYAPGDPAGAFEGILMTTTHSTGPAPADMTDMRAALGAGRVTASALVDRAIERAE